MLHSNRNPRLKQQHSNHQHHHQHHQQQSVSSSTGHSSHLHQRFLVHGGSVGHAVISQHQEKKRPYVKKPLNAYMLFMKEMRQSVIEECTLKESAAINQILGRKVSFCVGICTGCVCWICTGCVC
ncbi:hypothetical protein HELRODRAFT_68946 [Helobdella robusta]|uniref:HMG box domain-containing protein n=1 Tax=Helobdella robusta TaxID=6412 RepID=T1FZM4_HELRO|nr:hypothetical protein HELRODRAFT_68946 [Helobdella robusta]ESN94241.1 hypothetical protein HELRODRAFT_68946 [Helobdella robusta]